MSLSRDSRAERKLKFFLRKRFQIKQGLEKIDHEEDVIQRVMNDYKAGKALPELGLEAGEGFDINVVEDAIALCAPEKTEENG